MSAKRRVHASIFAALGDETRLALVAKLAAGQPYSISQLAKGSKLTRQAIRKHLGVLEAVGVVQSVRTGRENRFAFSPRPTEEIREYLNFVSQQWDHTLSRLRRNLRLSPCTGSANSPILRSCFCHPDQAGCTRRHQLGVEEWIGLARL
jgi:DNA-binding transcriptional ArsR family regulator